MASLPISLVGPDTLITIKISIQGTQKKLKLPLCQLVPATLPTKLREFLEIPDGQTVAFERFSDSSATYVNLDPTNVHAYKTLYRAAKAKLKLRLRAVPGPSPVQSSENTTQQGDNSAPASVGSSVTTPVVHFAPVAPTLISLNEVDVKPASHILPAQAVEDLAKSLRPLDPPPYVDTQAIRTSTYATLLDQKSIPSPTKKTFVHRGTLYEGLQNGWSVYCNNCDRNMLQEHYHCNVCDGGDYDLCQACMDAGVHCPGDNHWLIKRFWTPEGTINTSTTQVVGPKNKVEKPKEMPGAFTEEKKAEEPPFPTRTCNCCVKVLPENEFVTCTDCEDYDVCIPCLQLGKHGHHPAHRFEPATALMAKSASWSRLCAPGRNIMHAAICDSCDQPIVGVRYKCQVCPDWDYCHECMKSGHFTHAGHRFAPIYEPISMQRPVLEIRSAHHGIYCDGPLCKTTHGFIRGIRYKCAVCNDVDYCANCEASPLLEHNRTHPLIKFRTPVRSCSITTEVRDRNVSYHGDGDKRAFDAAIAAAAIAKVAASAAAAKAAASPVRVVADVKPAEVSTKEKIEIKNLLNQDVPVVRPANPQRMAIENIVSSPVASTPADHSQLQAHFVSDTISDGTACLPGQTFIQAWVMKNPGPLDWPAGCSVRYVGGDNMLDVDDVRPSAESDVSKAVETNILRHPVKAGDDFSFHVQMKAPKRQGCAISYWRLKAPDGTPFGHRLWCHINVTDQVAATLAAPTECPHVVKKTSCNAVGPEQKQNEQQSSDSAHREMAMRRRRGQHRRELEKNLRSQLYRSRPWLTEPGTEEQKVTLADALGPRTIRDDLKRHVGNALSFEEIEERLKQLKLFTEQASADEEVKREDKPASDSEVKKEPESPKMTFPVLVKEESVTATNSIATNAAASVSIPAVAEPTADSKAEDQKEVAESKPADEIFEDAESISLSDDEESSFHTDDEYDILNASDEEEIKA